MPKPIHLVLTEGEFDLSLLPKEARKLGTDAFRQGVTEYFRAQYAMLGGETSVEFRDGAILVTSIPEDADSDPMGAIIDMLSAGDYAQAKPILEALLQATPKDHQTLYNLGMVYSDEGRLGEAQELLRRAAAVAPDDANTWTALGVAALRAGDSEAARPALERAVRLEPNNPHALRTLGTLYAMGADHGRAVELLRSARKIAPNDPIILLSLGQSLLELDSATHSVEADSLLSQVLRLAPHGEIAEKAKRAKSRLASFTFRENASGGVRPDAVMYCLDALERFSPMSQHELAPILMEMATLGESGLGVNDTNKTYRLRSLPGEFAGLQLVCMMHVGMKRFDPAMGSGMDLDQEYEAALALYAGKSGRRKGGVRS